MNSVTCSPSHDPAGTTSIAPEEALEDLCHYAARVLALRLARMFAHAEGACQGDQTRPIHQMRVWSRRARAAHDLFGSCFPGKEYRDLGREIKAVTDALGDARDLDVMIETLQKRSSRLPEAQRPGIEAFAETLKKQRKKRQQQVERAVLRLQKRRVRERFIALLGEHGATLAPEPKAEAVGERASDG